MPDHDANVAFTDATVFGAEGQRVGIVTCMTCGAAVLIDGRNPFDPTMVHRLWHITEATDA